MPWAAWTSGESDLLPLAALTAVTLLIVLSRRLIAGSPLGASLALATAIGNLTDRVRVGHVIDFISVDFGSAQVILNIAEVALFVGLPLLVLAARSADGHASSRIGHLGGCRRDHVEC